MAQELLLLLCRLPTCRLRGWFFMLTDASKRGAEARGQRNRERFVAGGGFEVADVPQRPTRPKQSKRRMHVRTKAPNTGYHHASFRTKTNETLALLTQRPNSPLKASKPTPYPTKKPGAERTP